MRGAQKPSSGNDVGALGWKQKIFTSVIVSVSLFSIVLIFGAGKIYYSNVHEFQFSFTKFLPELLKWLLLLSAVSSLIISLVPQKYGLFGRIVAVMLAAALLFFVYGEVIVWRYGVMDGKDFDWHAYRHRSIIDACLAGTVLLVALFCYRLFFTRRYILCLAIFLVQLVGVAYLAANNKEAPLPKEKIALNMDWDFNFSAKRNVILIILDSLSAQLFEEAISEQRYKDIFTSFAYFNDFACGFSSTSPSIPLILTGKYYDNSMPLRDFISPMMLSDGIVAYCRNNNTRAKIYSRALTVQCTEEVLRLLSNTTTLAQAPAAEDFLELLSAAVFRYAPNFIKPYFQNSEIVAMRFWGARRGLWDFPFLEKMRNSREFTKNVTEPLFVMFHLKGSHPPQIIDENFNVHPNKVAPVQQAKAALNVVKIFIEKMKASGLYDNSTIIVTADHTRDSRNARIPLLVKETTAPNRPLRVVDTPLSLADMPRIVQTCLESRDFSAEQLEKNVARIYCRYGWNVYYRHAWGSSWGEGYLPPMTKYTIAGNPQDWNAFQFVSRMIPGIEPVALNQHLSINFTKDIESFKGFLPQNWGYAPGKGVVPGSPLSSMVFVFEDSPSGYLRFSANGTLVDAEKPGIVMIETKTGDSENSSTYNLNDTIFFPAAPEVWLRFTNVSLLEDLSFTVMPTTPPLEFNKKYPMNVFNAAVASLGDGIYQREEKGCWTRGDKAEMALVFENSPPEAPVELIIEASGFIHAPGVEKQRFLVYVGDRLIANSTVTERDAIEKIVIPLKKEMFPNGRKWELRLEFPDNISPKEAGISSDARKIAFFLTAIELKTVSE